MQFREILLEGAFLFLFHPPHFFVIFKDLYCNITEFWHTWFTNSLKMQICHNECNETQFWFQYLSKLIKFWFLFKKCKLWCEKIEKQTNLFFQTQTLLSGSCHLDRAPNVEIGFECQIFVIVIFFKCSWVLQFKAHSRYHKSALTQKLSFLVICTAFYVG